MSNKLAHSGIKGMRWGVRKEYTRLQNKKRTCS